MSVDDEVAQRLEAAYSALDLLRDQRDRVAVELQQVATLGEAQPLIDATRTLLDAIDAFVGGVFARVEARALDRSGRAGERVAAAERLKVATNNILRAVGGVSPHEETAENMSRLVDDVKSDIVAAVQVGSFGFGAVAALALVLIALK